MRGRERSAAQPTHFSVILFGRFLVSLHAGLAARMQASTSGHATPSCGHSSCRLSWPLRLSYASSSLSKNSAQQAGGVGAGWSRTCRPQAGCSWPQQRAGQLPPPEAEPGMRPCAAGWAPRCRRPQAHPAVRAGGTAPKSADNPPRCSAARHGGVSGGRQSTGWRRQRAAQARSLQRAPARAPPSLLPLPCRRHTNGVTRQRSGNTRLPSSAAPTASGRARRASG